MIALVIVLVVLILALLFAYLIAARFAKIVALPQTDDYEKTRKDQLERRGFDLLSVLENHKVEEFTYKSEFGYDIYGRIVRADDKVKFADGRQRAVILSHGWTSNHVNMLKYGKVYQELGFSLVCFDHRYHGRSDRSVNCTMGLYESKDLVGLGRYVRQFFPEDTVWGIQGESMGAATVMLAAPQMDWLSFACEDCGYSSVRAEMAANLEMKKLPRFPILNMGGAILKHRYGLDMDKVDAVKAVSETNIPMLFCHGDSDTFVPTRMVYDVYNAKKGKKRIQLFEGSEHAYSIWDHTDQYRQVLKSFLEEYKII